jgi:NitT/TauT family transport system permease protein
VDLLRRTLPIPFMPLLVLALSGLFAGSNFGLELSAILMMFLAQAFPLATSFRHVLRSAPHEQQEMATVFRFSWWQRFKWVELPWTMMSLVWNSMLCMARGWFVLMVSEAFVLGKENFQLPGVGSYMREAVNQGRPDAIGWALVAIATLIIVLDQSLWRPLVVWAQKFRLDEEGPQEEMTCWFLNWLRHSRLVKYGAFLVRKWMPHGEPRPLVPGPEGKPRRDSRWKTGISLTVLLLLFLPLAYGAGRLVLILMEVSPEQWAQLVLAALTTLARVALATGLGVLWALPLGLVIGLSPRLSRWVQPVVQVLISFPAPLLFPLAAALLYAVGVPLTWGAVLLMMLASQGYILFNVIAGAMTIPADLKEAVRSYHMPVWHRFRYLYLPAVFPYLMTGWETAGGAAWGASFVVEYVTLQGGQVLETWGLGATISAAAQKANYALLAASLVVLSTVMYLIDREVWGRCHRLALRRFTLS